MIELSKRIIKDPVIRLTPRAGFKRSHKALEFPLVYGHICPTCNNVITAYFLADQEIDLWPYEESVILSQGENNAGEILKTVPEGTRGKHYSQYNSQFFDCGPGKSAQKLMMKNHVFQADAIKERYRLLDTNKYTWHTMEAALWQVGERPCLNTCVFNEREDLAIRDLLLLFWVKPESWHHWNIPAKVADFIPKEGQESAGFRIVNAIGNGPPVILGPREKFNRANHPNYIWLIRPLLDRFAVTQ